MKRTPLRRAVAAAALAWLAALPAAAQPAAAASQSSAVQRPDAAALRRQVADTETAFARSMADRDFAAFAALLSEQAVFSGGPKVLRGKAEVAAAWKAYFDGPKAPFSWSLDAIEVLGDGTLAHTTGPVRDADGKLILRFTSVWRQEAPGVWRIVFDKGQPLETTDRDNTKP